MRPLLNSSSPTGLPPSSRLSRLTGLLLGPKGSLLSRVGPSITPVMLMFFATACFVRQTRTVPDDQWMQPRAAEAAPAYESTLGATLSSYSELAGQVTGEKWVESGLSQADGSSKATASKRGQDYEKSCSKTNAKVSQSGGKVEVTNQSSPQFRVYRMGLSATTMVYGGFWQKGRIIGCGKGVQTEASVTGKAIARIAIIYSPGTPNRPLEDQLLVRTVKSGPGTITVRLLDQNGSEVPLKAVGNSGVSATTLLTAPGTYTLEAVLEQALYVDGHYAGSRNATTEASVSVQSMRDAIATGGRLDGPIVVTVPVFLARADAESLVVATLFRSKEHPGEYYPCATIESKACDYAKGVFLKDPNIGMRDGWLQVNARLGGVVEILQIKFGVSGEITVVGVPTVALDPAVPEHSSARDTIRLAGAQAELRTRIWLGRKVTGKIANSIAEGIDNKGMVPLAPLYAEIGVRARKLVDDLGYAGSCVLLVPGGIRFREIVATSDPEGFRMTFSAAADRREPSDCQNRQREIADALGVSPHELDQLGDVPRGALLPRRVPIPPYRDGEFFSTKPADGEVESDIPARLALKRRLS